MQTELPGTLDQAKAYTNTSQRTSGRSFDLVVDYVHPSHLERAWPHVEPHLIRAVNNSKGQEYQLSDIVDEILAENQILWAVYTRDTKEVIAAATTHMVEYPSGIKAVAFCMVGGDKAENWFGHLSDVVEAWGRMNGAHRIEGLGRRGWVRKWLKNEDYKELYMMFAKEIDYGRQE